MKQCVVAALCLISAFVCAIANEMRLESAMKWCLPGGKMLSRSRTRAEARSLTIYWRRTYLNTEQKVAPSSVLRKGSLSHRSVKKMPTANDGVKNTPPKKKGKDRVWHSMQYRSCACTAKRRRRQEAALWVRPTWGWAAGTSTDEETK